MTIFCSQKNTEKEREDAKDSGDKIFYYLLTLSYHIKPINRSAIERLSIK